MSKKLEERLLNRLSQLEKAAEQIRKTQGYNNKLEEMMILIEMIREQVPHANTRPATRATR